MREEGSQGREGPVVLVTGCSTGIGRDLVARLAARGFRVVATARDPRTLEDLGAARALALDVTRPDSVAAAVQAALDEFGRLDALVNNAGFASAASLEDLPESELKAMFEVNLHGVFRMIRAVAPGMRRRGQGIIVNVGSIAGKWSMGVNGGYSASKHALEGLTDAARQELKPFGIAVHLVDPGPVRSDFVRTSEARTGPLLDDPASPYAGLYARYRRFTASSRKSEVGPEVVSRIVIDFLEGRRRGARAYAGVPLLMRLILGLGDGVKDGVYEAAYGRGSA